MTATYVAVTAVAVLLTELVIFGAAALSPATELTPAQVQGLAQGTAYGMAAKLAPAVGPAGQLPSENLGVPGTTVTPGQAQVIGTDKLAIGQTPAPYCDLAPASVAVAVSHSGTVLASSYPACFPVGGTGSAAQGGAPRKVLASFVRWGVPSSGQATLPGGQHVVWATVPITLAPVKDTGTTASPGPLSGKVYAMLYVQVPATGPGAGGFTVSAGLVRTGLIVLLGAVPVGLAFGLLSTWRLTRRLKRLAGLSLSVADGDFGRRVPVSGHDEVSTLEENFNRMAGQLQASLDATRALAAANARHEERSRIARELHDSISQELFSLSVLAGGLRRALPASTGAAVLGQVETMERTAGDTMREMQSLLLALRPVALDEVGLASAIEEICHAYTERLGVRVTASVEPLALGPTVEHAILRVTQEALGNAVRHSGASLVTVRLRGDSPGVAELEVTDDGHGFDVAAREAGSTGVGAGVGAGLGAGLGLRAMRDRVSENGGRLTIESSADGTRVRACFPRTAQPRPAQR
jgi:signal transduction histidine kinase